MKRLLGSFGLSTIFSMLVFGYAFGWLGVQAGIVTLVLAAIEMAFSFDNAVINAKVLASLSIFWRKLFLTLGIIVAVVGVRALLPVLIVALTAHKPMLLVVGLALHRPADYARVLISARPAITAFGGAFLLMISLNFFLTDREVKWVQAIERPLSKLERRWLPLPIAAIVLLAIIALPLNEHRQVEFMAGSIGLLSYTIMQMVIRVMDRALGQGNQALRVGWSALATFMYLELLDASLSFDGVIGAFAITSNVILIALGLGVGALWVRSLTVFMVKHHTLEVYKYLEHGAHYAITVLAITMLLGAVVEVPDVLTGILSLGLIVAAIIASRQALEAGS